MPDPNATMALITIEGPTAQTNVLLNLRPGTAPGKIKVKIMNVSNAHTKQRIPKMYRPSKAAIKRALRYHFWSFSHLEDVKVDIKPA